MLKPFPDLSWSFLDTRKGMWNILCGRPVHVIPQTLKDMSLVKAR